MSKSIVFKDGKVDRRFTSKWDESSVVRTEEIPFLVEQLVSGRNSLIEYIEALHDKLDFIMERNNICDNQRCLRANCTSDHQ